MFTLNMKNIFNKRCFLLLFILSSIDIVDNMNKQVKYGCIQSKNAIFSRVYPFFQFFLCVLVNFEVHTVHTIKNHFAASLCCIQFLYFYLFLGANFFFCSSVSCQFAYNKYLMAVLIFIFCISNTCIGGSTYNF